MFLPGLGANESLFIEQKKKFPHALFPKWLAPHKNESLSSYAKRWANEFSPTPKILVGMSFGSQVAIELAHHLDVKKVIVISGFSSSEQVSNRFRRQVKWGLCLPDFFIRFIARHILAKAFAKTERLSAEHQNVLKKMVDDMDLHFFRWASKAAADWKTNQMPNCPIIEIHGENDAVITLRDKRKAPQKHLADLDSPVDHLIRDASHLIQMTKAEIVNRILEDEFKK